MACFDCASVVPEHFGKLFFFFFQFSPALLFFKTQKVKKKKFLFQIFEFELRKPSSNFNEQLKLKRPELLGGASIVRELHIYGSAVPVHNRDPKKFQHQGFGTLLMEEAERIAREEHGSKKLAVISGVGTRHYYRRLGYSLDGPYMSKTLL